MEKAGAIIGEKDFLAFLDTLKKLESVADERSVQDILMVGGIALRDDVRKLPRPRQNIAKATHMLDLVDAERTKTSVKVGWTEEGYYGAFVERGTRFLKKTTPHIGPTWESNKIRYYQLMADKLYQKGGL